MTAATENPVAEPLITKEDRQRSLFVTYDSEGNPEGVETAALAMARTKILRDKLYALTARVDTIEELIIARDKIAELTAQVEAKQEAEL